MLQRGEENHSQSRFTILLLHNTPNVLNVPIRVLKSSVLSHPHHPHHEQWSNQVKRRDLQTIAAIEVGDRTQKCAAKSQSCLSHENVIDHFD